MSQVYKEILSSNSSNWESRLLRRELRQLTRENEHLQDKMRERNLSAWELERIAVIMDEIMDLLPQISAAARDAQKKR